MHRPAPSSRVVRGKGVTRSLLIAALLVASGVACPPPSSGPGARGRTEQPTYRYARDADCEARIEEAARNYKSDTALKLATDCAHEYDRGLRATIMVLVRAEMRRLGEVAMDIPEFHDEQRLAGDGVNALGPFAGIFASPYLASFNHPWQMRGQGKPGVLAGYVVVMQQDNEPLPASYTALNLGWGVNCVFLESKAGGFDAWIIQPGVDKTCRDEFGAVAIPAGLLPLQVNVRPIGRPKADMVPAARFLEDNAGRTVFGLPCLRDWCEIGVPGFVSRTTTFCDWFTGDPAFTCPTNREAQIPSWYDEQRLEERSGAAWRATNIRAAIVPQPGIGDLRASDFDAPKHVANVYVSADPPATGKLHRRGLRKGENRLELHNHPTNGWQYTVRAISRPLTAAELAALKPIKVLGPHKHYDAPVPGTTRWRFTIQDPGVWGPCGGLCCDGEGF